MTEGMSFGRYIRNIRLQDSREVTLKNLSEILGMSLTFLSDIESGRRRPFDSDKLEKFCDYFHLEGEARTQLYDLAAVGRREIPSDIEDTMMYSNIGNMARHALRLANAGIGDEEDWKQFIRQLEAKKEGSGNAGV